MKTSEFDAFFVSEIVALALNIAQHQRGEQELQPAKVLYEKFQKEKQELAEAENIWDELPDVIYYATCLIARGENYYFTELIYDLLPRYPVSAAQVKAATLAKYRRRAAGHPKDIEAEREIIAQAVEEVNDEVDRD